MCITMVRYSATNVFVLSTVFIASLTSVTTGLSLQEFSLRFEQLEQNNAKLSLEIQALKQNDVSETLKYKQPWMQIVEYSQLHEVESTRLLLQEEEHIQHRLK